MDDNSCVNSARNKDIRKVLSVHFTDRLTDFRATLYSGAKSSKEHTEFILQQSGRLCMCNKRLCIILTAHANTNSSHTDSKRGLGLLASLLNVNRAR